MLWGEFSANFPISYTNEALAAAGRPVVADGFALHPYAKPFAQLPGGIANLGEVNEQIARWARAKRRRLAAPGGGTLPVYATEYGCLTRASARRSARASGIRGSTRPSVTACAR